VNIDGSSSKRLPERITVRVLDAEITPLDAQRVADLVVECARGASGLVIGNLNLHGVYLLHTDPTFALYTNRADVVLVDGAPIALLGGVSLRLRVGSTDWLDLFMQSADGLRVLAVGGTADTSRKAERHFRNEYPSVIWNGVDGYSSQDMNDGLAALIADSDVILVGMGMPIQEAWILRNLDLLQTKVVANVGGCFDYYAGNQRLAPRWMGRLGIEWLYRLSADPARLAHRYLVEPLKLIALLMSRKLRAQSRRGDRA
jgi:N-acetylglucosaminyldiphosphoundecaprenol N-acetyl-beta-D-mannosaminyltransferase